MHKVNPHIATSPNNYDQLYTCHFISSDTTPHFCNMLQVEPKKLNAMGRNIHTKMLWRR